MNVARIPRLPTLAALVLVLGACSNGESDDRPGSTRCRPGPGASGAPASIDEVVKLVNTLPRPVTLPCFVESLDRPLLAAATVSRLSLQPAPGQQSPRVFLFSGPLVMSLVPEGKGSHLLEFGQFVAEARTLKAELDFPVTDTVERGYPFRRILSATGSACRVCHADEQPAVDIIDYAPAFISGALRPLPRDRVAIEAVADAQATCNAATEPTRCALLDAIFRHGEVRGHDFPAGVPTL